MNGRSFSTWYTLIRIEYCTWYFMVQFRDGSRIPRRRGRQPSRRRAPAYKFARFSDKLHEIKKILVCRGGCAPGELPSPLGSATAVPVPSLHHVVLLNENLVRIVHHFHTVYVHITNICCKVMKTKSFKF